ncbi:MAG: NAD(+) synthase [Proteobacteria bacterium]|nr:NAD(+) synthase [Pseudomonadota bacterium]
MEFSRDVLKINSNKETESISNFIRDTILKDQRKKGAVIGVSGGIDSAVSAALCIRALGCENVLGIILPEKESQNISERYALLLAEKLGIRTEKVDITATLEQFGVYEKRHNVVNRNFPDFDASTWKYKIVLPGSLLEKDRLNVFSLVVQLPDGSEQRKRLNSQDYFEIVAASNIKQRTRMVYLYYFADRNNYAEVGTTNRTEAHQGFFVKYGDGGVDLEPLAHLYKSQIYMLAEYLDIPEEIRQRTPSPDTYTAEVSDTEFYFGVPFDILDFFLWADENNIPSARICKVLSLSEQQYRRIKRDIDQKSRIARHFLKTPPQIRC